MKQLLIKIGKITLKHKNKTITSLNEKQTPPVDNKITDELLKTHNNKINTKKIIPLLLIIPLILLIIQPQIGIEILIIIALLIFVKYKMPEIKQQKRQKSILKVLPFALREMSTQLKAGIGLFDALQSIVESNYGELSKEFKITLNEIQYSTNYIDAFNSLSERVNSQVFDNVINQITRTLTNGGNLADILNTIANEHTRNMKIKYKEYSEKLNSVMLIYMFIAVLIPVILFIMIIAATTVMGPIIQGELVVLLYLIFFPLIIILIIIFIKNMEPTI